MSTAATVSQAILGPRDVAAAAQRARRRGGRAERWPRAATGGWGGRVLAVVVMTTALACNEPKDAPPVPTERMAPSLPSASAQPAPPPAAPPPVARKRKDPAACPKVDPVVFDDPVLEAAVRRQTQKPTGAITRADLRRVKTLDLSQASRNDELDPCIFAHFSGLKSLYLAPGELDDVTVLRSSPNIESLRLAATRVTDLRPLAALRHLDRLDIGRTPVRDLSPLADLRTLTELQIDDTEVDTLAPLAKLDNLEVLLMKRTRVKDVSPLRSMRKLKHLYIEGSTVDDVSALAGLRGLKIHQGT